ncbi:non-ribosomal peptide synthetase [Streptomyces sp. NPDC005438]|uniref:non-ribosomal peptide synthetase n=1 Tax=Streptomyces sp. NPDC005438 TaxID=3156880 RepID=UPI0033ACC3F4
MHRILAEHADRRPSQPAVVDEDGTPLSYQQLWERSGWLAAALAARGVGPGDRVAVALRRSARLVVALLGVARLGAAYVPLDSQAPATRLALITDEALPTAVVTDEEWVTLPSGLPRVTVPTQAPGGAVPDVAAIKGATEADTPLYVAYTSGSTGRPKGVVITHGAVRSFTDSPRYCEVRPGDRVAALANPAFDATTFEVWNTLVAGATVVVLPDVVDLSVTQWVDLLRDRSVGTVFLTTALFDGIAREAPGAFQTLDNLLVGGEALDIERVRSVLASPPRRLVHVYGPTETTTFATAFTCTPDNLAGRTRVPLGPPVQQTRVHVLDDQRREVAPGATGELYISGPQLATGYLGAPGLTDERFVQLPGGQRAYRSGDLVRTLTTGDLEFVGRADRQVKLRGFRVELEEVELALTATGLVSAAAVEKLGEAAGGTLVAFVRPAAPEDADDLTPRLAKLLAEHLPGYMVPHRFLVVPEMPLTTNGKTDRARLLAMVDGQLPPEAAPDNAPEGAEAPHGAPDGVLGELLTVLAELLEVDRVSPHDNFLELGGNSILALQATSRLRSRCDADVNPADLIFAETLAELGDPVADATGGGR